MLVLISVLVGIAALFGWTSSRVLRLPNTIGTMFLTAVTSVALGILAPIWPGPHDSAVHLIRQIDFQRLILHGMLPLLLFAGAFLLDLEALRRQKLAVALLSVIATAFSALAVGGLTWYAVRLFGFSSSLLECLLFGALISPTDPIAVLEMLRRVNAPKHLEAQLAGESLFNDGIGAVIFLSLLAATQGAMPSAGHIVTQMLISAGGGILVGALLAVPIAFLMRALDNPPVDLLLSLALALGGYVIAEVLSISAPLEAVAAGLVLRSIIERLPSERVAHRDLKHFWSNLDEIQNAILFVLLGCGFLVVSFHRPSVYLGLSEVVIVNVVRIASVALVLLLLKLLRTKCLSSLAVLSWGGLRGGLSIALALTIPATYGSGWVVSSTYVLVTFSILIQGSTMGLFLRRWQAAPHVSCQPVSPGING
ncbi:MAG TPA: sodium:proton antiporter [Acidobacteriaceae bacterium]|nr:sodium:proton antiporter [Acidobacteriaceae bacterium]